MNDLVLLHGWAMNSAVWAPLLPLLEKRFQVTLLELPGHGEAPWKGGETLNDWAEQVLAVGPPARPGTSPPRRRCGRRSG